MGQLRLTAQEEWLCMVENGQCPLSGKEAPEHRSWRDQPACKLCESPGTAEIKLLQTAGIHSSQSGDLKSEVEVSGLCLCL